jgi:hypothetical protein
MRLSKPDYVLNKLLYFLARFSPAARLEFMRRALVEVARLPGGYGVDISAVRPAGPADPLPPALPAPTAAAKRRRIGRGRT